MPARSISPNQGISKARSIHAEVDDQSGALAPSSTGSALHRLPPASFRSPDSVAHAKATPVPSRSTANDPAQIDVRTASVLTDQSPTQANVRPPHQTTPTDSPSAQTRHGRIQSGQFYTASWGSPYQASPSDQRLRSIATHRQTLSCGSDELDDDSPIHHLTLDQLRPLPFQQGWIPERRPPLQARAQTVADRPRPSTSDSSTRSGKRPTRGSSEDWTRPAPLGRSRSERANWWSDDSGEGDSARRPKAGSSSVLTDEYEDDWLGLDKGRLGESPKTPTLRDALRERDWTQAGRRARASTNRSRHSSSVSNLTLRRGEFFTSLDEAADSPHTPDKMLLSKYADPPAAAAPAERADESEAAPLPEAVTPVSPTARETSPDLPAPHNILPESPTKDKASVPRRSSQSLHRPGLSRTVTAKVPRKRVIWKGKPCIIALPANENYGTARGIPLPMPAAEVIRRLQAWEDAGYDVRGFGHWGGKSSTDREEGESQSRLIYPNASEWAKDKEGTGYRVNIPDRKEWEAYVRYLKEEKLRALGVSSGDDAPPSTLSPAASSMSRQQSSQHTSLAFSPPPLTSSAISNHTTQNPNPFSPPFIPGVLSNPSPHLTTVASPGVSNTSTAGFFGGRQGIAPVDGEKPFGSPFQISGQPTPSYPGIWSPQQLQPNAPRGASPVVNGKLQNVGSLISPGHTPDLGKGPGVHSQQPVDQQNLLQSRLLHQQILQHQQHQLQQQQQRSLAQTVPQKENTKPGGDERKTTKHARADSKWHRAPDKLNIITPIPLGHGHRHNVSETLQREIDEAELRLEETKQEEYQNEDALRLDATSPFDTGDMVIDSVFGLEVPKPAEDRSRGNVQQEVSLPRAAVPKKAPEVVDSSTTKHKSPLPAPAAVAKTEKAPEPEVRPRVSSLLSVTAKEFKFDPTSSFAPGNFSFKDSKFQPSTHEFGRTTRPAQPRPSASTLGGLASNLNVEAPVFQPGGAAPSAVPTSDFSFVSSGPSFRPNAPSFTPGALLGQQPVAAAVPSKASDVTVPTVPKIFDPDFIVKPPKASNAVPIIPPEKLSQRSSLGADDEAQEDESGRITQPTARRKRVRHGDNGGSVSPPGASPRAEENDHASRAVDEAGSNLKIASSKEDGILEDRPSNLPSKKPSTAPKSAGLASEQDTMKSLPERPRAVKQESPPPIKSQPNPATASPKLLETRSSDEDMGELSAQKLDLPDTAAEQNALRSLSPSPIHTPPAAPKPKSLGLSRFAHSPSPPPAAATVPTATADPEPVKPVEAVVLEVKAVEAARESSSGAPPVADAHEEEVELVYPSLDGGAVRTSDAKGEGPLRPATPAQAAIRTPEASSPIEGQDLARAPRSNNPSPSPRRVQPQPNPKAQKWVVEAASLDDGPAVSAVRAALADERPIHRLNASGEFPISDWNDVLSASEEHKIPSRSHFFDNHVEELLGSLVQSRIQPLEKMLKTMSESMAVMASDRPVNSTGRRSTSVEMADSDADDEDDEDQERRGLASRPSKGDRKLERIRHVVVEALAAHQPSTTERPVSRDLPAPVPQPAPLQEDALRSIMKAVVQEHVGAQSKDLGEQSRAEMEAMQLSIKALEHDLKESQRHADEQRRGREAMEEKLVKTQKQLQTAEAESENLRGFADEKDRKLRAFDEKKHQDLVQTQMRTALLEGAQENLQKKTAELSAKNGALESSLRDARMTDAKSRAESERTEAENKDLRRTMGALKMQMEESVRVREGLRGKFDQMQADMTKASREFTAEQASWRKRDGENRVQQETMRARLQAEARTRERLEREIERLEGQELEGMRMRVQVEQVQKANHQLGEMVKNIRLENADLHRRAAHFEGEFNEAREAGRAEVQRTRTLMEADIEAANNQVNIVRDNLESELTRARTELDYFKMEVETAKNESALMLEEATRAKGDALREAEKAHHRVVEEHRHRYERHVDDLRSQHDRDLGNAVEDKQRAETHLLERLGLSNAKTEHLQDKVGHLEEKLEIARSAAHAAVQAAQSAKSVPPTGAKTTSARDMELPEKISPQALRESILVLQEQLQERERRIETLEADLAKVDPQASDKIIQRDAEIGWLRELLGVRVGDLQDIAQTLEQPEFDVEAVKDAAIRLKANIQMEQQDRERAAAGGQSFPSFASIAQMTSPKAVLPLAAAWGNWRRGREPSSSNLSAGGSSDVQTPSKSSPQSFLSGLLTPPSTSMRQTPHRSGASMPRRSLAHDMEGGRPLGSAAPASRRQEKRPAREPPSTPPLLRTGSYDRDAEPNGFIPAGLYDDDHSTVDGQGLDRKGAAEKEEAEDEPFGPQIAS